MDTIAPMTQPPGVLGVPMPSLGIGHTQLRSPTLPRTYGFIPNPVPTYPDDCRCCNPPGEECSLPSAKVNDLSGYTLGGTLSPSFTHNSYYRDDVGTYPHPVYVDYDVCSSNPPKPSEGVDLRGAIKWWLDDIRAALVSKPPNLIVCDCTVEGPSSTRYDYCGQFATMPKLYTFNPQCPGSIAYSDFAMFGCYEGNAGQWFFYGDNLTRIEYRVTISVWNRGLANELYRVLVSTINVQTAAQEPLPPCAPGPNVCAFFISTGAIVGCESASAGDGGGGYHIAASEIYNNVGTAPTFQVQQDFPTASYATVNDLITAITTWLNARAGLARFSTFSSVPFQSDRWIDAVDWSINGPFAINPLS